MTAYVVLIYLPADDSDGQGSWQLIGDAVTARSASSAIRELVEHRGEGQYVATPARSWKPVQVTVETKTEVKIG